MQLGSHPVLAFASWQPATSKTQKGSVKSRSSASLKSWVPPSLASGASPGHHKTGSKTVGSSLRSWVPAPCHSGSSHKAESSKARSKAQAEPDQGSKAQGFTGKGAKVSPKGLGSGSMASFKGALGPTSPVSFATAKRCDSKATREGSTAQSATATGVGQMAATTAKGLSAKAKAAKFNYTLPEVKVAHKHRHEWMCPICTAVISCKTEAGMFASKFSHWKTRHPEQPTGAIFTVGKPVVVEVSATLPNEHLNLNPRTRRAWPQAPRPPGFVPGSDAESQHSRRTHKADLDDCLQMPGDHGIARSAPSGGVPTVPPIF